MGKNWPILFEVLEPRIMLSADGLLNVITPDQDQDALPDGMQDVIQYAELLETQEQFEEQVTSDTSNNDNCRPILTLSVDDDKANVESGDADLSVDNIGPAQTGEIALLSNDSDEYIESKVGTTEDASTPTYVNYGEISVEETLSIEIRGPPASETISSEITTSSYIDNEELEANHNTLDEYAAELQPDGTVNLPGLVLVNPDLTNLEGQTVYLDFDGEKNVTYSGPVLVENIDVPEFTLPGSLAGQEEVVITRVVEELERIFADLGVIFTTERPVPTQPYSTVYVGGNDSAFDEYGAFRGLSEQVDIGNENLCDNAFVFSETFVNENNNANTLATQLANVIAHEVGHLLGYAHEHETVPGGRLSAVAWVELTGDPGLWPYADGPTQETVVLPHSVYRMGTTVGIYEDQPAIFSVGGWSLRAGAYVDYSRDAPGSEPKYWGNRQSHFSIYLPNTDTWISADGTDDIDNGDDTWTSVRLTGYNDGNGTHSPWVERGTGFVMDQCFYHNGAVYVFGGYPQWGGQMAKYDIAANSWSEVALGDDDGLYKNGGGGLIGSHWYSHWYKVHKEGLLIDYDVGADTFGPDIAIDGLKNPAIGAGAGVIGDKLYIVDTFEAIVPGAIYEIDPIAKTVVEKSPAPTPVREAGTVLHDGLLYVLGGRTASTNDSATDIIQIYNPVLDKWWISTDKLPDARSGFLAEIVGDTLYIGNGINNLSGNEASVLDDLWSSSIPAVPGPGKEVNSSDCTLLETVVKQELTLEGITVRGDFQSTLDFTSFEIVTITTGPFAGKGFSKGKCRTTLDGVLYEGDWNGAVFLEPQGRKIYLKGAISGEIEATVEGYLNESVPESSIYDEYYATWNIGHLGGRITSGTINLSGSVSAQSSSEFGATNLYVLQSNVHGVTYSYYDGELSCVVNHVRIQDVTNPYDGEGFSMISYLFDSGSGQGWTYDKAASPGKLEMKGLFSYPFFGIVSGVLDESEVPRTLSMTVQRVDFGVPPAPDLKVIAWGPKRVSPGESVTYILEYRNDGLKITDNATVMVWPTCLSTFRSASSGGNYDSEIHLLRWDSINVPVKGRGFLYVGVEILWGLPPHIKLFNQADIHASPQQLSPPDELYEKLFEKEKARLWRELGYAIVDGSASLLTEPFATYVGGYIMGSIEIMDPIIDIVDLKQWVYSRYIDELVADNVKSWEYWADIDEYIRPLQTLDKIKLEDLVAIERTHGWSLELDPGTSEIFTAHDPNIKYGPEGNVCPGEQLDYKVEYENEGEGIAYGVYFTDTLDGDLDDSTLEIGPVIDVEDGSIIAEPGIYNPATRTITWFAGEVGPGEGGCAEFSVNVRDDASHGTEIINYATVYFPSVPEETRTNGIVSVVSLNQLPVAVDNSYGVNEDNILTVAASGVLDNDTDPDEDAINATLVSEPDYGTLSLNADGSFVYEPDLNFNGSDSFTYVANDGTVDSNEATVWITVNPINDAPQALPALLTSDEDTPISIDMQTLVSDVETSDEDLTFTVGDTTNGSIELLQDSHTALFTPAANYSRPASFTYSVTDTGDNGAPPITVGPVTIDVTINAVADVPPLVVQDAAGEEGTPIPLSIMAGLVDTDGSETLQILIAGVPAGAALSKGIDNGDGSWTLLPEDLVGLMITVPDDAVFDLTVIATATEASNGSTASATAVLTVTVINVAPIVVLDPVSAINEDGLATLTGTITDPGTLDTFTLEINWGDPLSPNNDEMYTLGCSSTGVQVFTLSHQYLDDNPSGIPSDSYTIVATVTDDDAATGDNQTAVDVNNLAPEITEFSSDATFSDKGSENEDVAVFASFVDVGKLDTHTAEIHWGDGVVTQGTVTESAGVGTVSASHAYAFGGIYTISLILVDDDSGIAQATTTAVITGVGVQNGQLQIIGTDAKDKVSINLVGGKHSGKHHGDNHKGKPKKQYVRVHANFLPKVHSGDDDDEDDDGRSRFRDFDADAVSSILMVLCDGDDHAKIAGNIAIDAITDGGHGRDKLKGGAGNDIVLGGAGNDKIQGGRGADILIGGLGSDRLVGNKGNDILIGDTTVYDSDQAEDKFADVEALLAILDEWTSERDFETRVNNLKDGTGSSDRLNDSYFLQKEITVFDDSVRDHMTGSSGKDWFISFDSDKDHWWRYSNRTTLHKFHGCH